MSSHLSDVDSEVAKLANVHDPDNYLLWRYPMRRLSAEEIRDSVLATTGVLNEELFGRAFIL